MSKKKICELGTKQDIKTHTRKARTDNRFNKLMLERVREHMFVRGKGVNTQAVKLVLDAESLVPTRVRSASDIMVLTDT